MQLADVGRNEPCPCGSGQKYKKCCLVARHAAVAIDPEMMVAVDRAIEDDDWEPLHGRVAAAMTMFEAGEPLEHVRFWHDRVRSRAPDAAELATLCTVGWLRGCELEIARVLDRYEISDEERDGLRLAAYLLRRFGAQSPTVEEIARLQVAEHVLRVRGLANAVSAQGLTMEEVLAAGPDLVKWIERVRPTVLSFAEWLALRISPGERFDELWFSGIAMRVCEACLDRLDEPSLEDRRFWLDLAAVTLIVRRSTIGKVLAYVTAPRQVTADERLAYEALLQRRRDDELRGIIPRIERETETRGDFADAALLRGVMHGVQSLRRSEERSVANSVE